MGDLAPHPNEWRRQVMDGARCKHCDYVEGQDNPAAVFRAHQAHLLGEEHTPMTPARVARAAPPTGDVPVWLAKDPVTERICMQTREFADEDFPRGARGLNWPRRTAVVDAGRLADLLTARLTPDEQTALHLELWGED